MEFNQTYKAPSIPKLSKRTISSPFGKKSALSKLQLKKSSFSFIKKSPLTETVENNNILKPLEVTRNDALLTDTLLETNRILVEIQKQLAFDFASRIVEEKETLKKFKEEKSRKKFKLKENVLESAKKIGSGLFNQVNQILEPTKSIFQKIIDFFGIILTGIAVNAAFKWLENPENRKKLSELFEFLTKNWKVILGLLGTAYILRLLYGVYRVSKLVFNILKLIRGGGKTPTTPKVTPSPKILSPKSTSKLNQSYAKFIEGKANIGDTLRLARRGFIKPSQILSKGGVEALQGTVKTSTTTSPRGIGRGGIAGTIALTLAEIFKPQIQDYVGQLYNKMGIGYGNKTNDELKREYREEKNIQQNLQSGPLGQYSQYDDSRLRMLEDELKKRNLKFNDGGTVKGRDKRDRDSVPSLLTVGEEIINKSSSMLFRPLLKDLNDNAGRLWNQFKQAVLLLTSTNKEQKQISTVFGDVIKDFNNFLKSEIVKSKINKKPEGGGFGLPPASSKSTQNQSVKPQKYNINVKGGKGEGSYKTAPTPKLYVTPSSTSSIKPSIKRSTVSNISQPVRSYRPSIVPMAMDLPPIQSSIPQIPSIGEAQSSEVPNISSVNPADPYLQITKRIYGIYVIG